MPLFPPTAGRPGPRRAAETIYDFLCRAEGAYWGRVRNLLEQWLAHVPADAADDLVARFSGGNAEQVVSAFYVHEGFRRSGFHLTPHPELAETARRPDFGVEGHGLAFHLECVVAGDPEELHRSDARRRQLYDTVNRLENDEFFLNLQIEREGQTSPSGATLRRRVDAWLRGLDRPALRRRAEQTGLAAMPEQRFDLGDWAFRVTAIPKSDERAGQPSGSAIGVFPGRTGYSAVRQRLVDALEFKASRYGDLDRPYVIAALSTGTFADNDEDLLGALFGQMGVAFHDQGGADWRREWTRLDNGFFSARRNRRVSAVITATHLAPWSVGSPSPRLWRNPWAERPLELSLDWLAAAPIREVDGEGQIDLEPAAVDARTFFGLPLAWPGPERPFA